MALEIALVIGFCGVLALCVAVLVWDIKRRRIAGEESRDAAAQLESRIADLEDENRRLRDEIAFLEKMNREPRV